MLRIPKVLPPRLQLPYHPTAAAPPQSVSPAVKFSRRVLTVIGNVSLLLLGARAPEPLDQSKARAEDDGSSSEGYCAAKMSNKRAFLDVSIDGEPAGRIVIGLYEEEAPAGAARLGDLLSGAAGVTLRRKEFVRITPEFVQHVGVRSLSPAEGLVEEWRRVRDRCPGLTRATAGTVGILVRDPSKPPPKPKLVARRGRLEVEEEEPPGTEPNGTELIFARRDSPGLDDSTLVVGRVVEGMNVVEKIGQVKTVRENTSSPYFQVAKLIGDKRAVVAERGFNRPYSKVLVTNCGMIQ